MIKKCIAICVCLFVVAGVVAQSRSKPVKQPAEVIKAYRVCNEFQRLLAEDLDFDRAFEATFIKDPVRRREVAIAEADHGEGDLSQVDTETVVDIYRSQAQLIILVLPLLYGDREEDKAKLFPPPFDEMLKLKLPSDPKQLPAYAAQLKRVIPEFRVHVEKVVQENPEVAKTISTYKAHLLKPIVPPNRVVKPLTAYSKGNVLRTNEKYYQIGDCAVVREDGKMRLIGYTFFKLRG